MGEGPVSGGGRIRNFSSKFALVVAAAKRARQLRDSQRPLILANSDKEPVLALEELLQGKVTVEVRSKEEPEVP